jgi:hypothetical protein
MLIGQIEYELLEANLWYLGQVGCVDLEAASEYQASQEPELEPRSVLRSDWAGRIPTPQESQVDQH